jgi:hypothetical protein
MRRWLAAMTQALVAMEAARQRLPLAAAVALAAMLATHVAAAMVMMLPSLSAEAAMAAV